MNLLSVFGGGLWIIPILILGGTIFFGVLGLKASQSGSRRQNTATGEWIETPGNIPFHKTGYGKFAIALAIALIVVIILMVNDK